MKIKLVTLLFIVMVSQQTYAADVYYGAGASCGTSPFTHACFLNNAGITYSNPAGTNLIPGSISGPPPYPYLTEFVNQGSIENYGYIGSAVYDSYKVPNIGSYKGIYNDSSAILNNFGAASEVEAIKFNNLGTLNNEGTIRVNSYQGTSYVAADTSTGYGKATGYLNNAGALHNSGRIENRGNIENTGDFTNASGAEIVSSSNSAGSIINIGLFNPEAYHWPSYEVSIVNSAIANQGFVNQGHIVNGDPTDFNNGIHSSTLTNLGLLNNIGGGVGANDGMINNYGTITNWWEFNNTNGATVNNWYVFNNLHGSFSNSSTSQFNNQIGASFVHGELGVSNAGFRNDGQFSNQGTLENNMMVSWVSPLDETFHNATGAQLQNLGQFTNRGIFTNQGSFINGASATTDSIEAIYNSGTITNDGLLVNRKLFDDRDGTIYNGITGTIQNEGQFYAVNTTINNAGQILFDGSTAGLHNVQINPTDPGSKFIQTAGTTELDSVKLAAGNIELKGGDVNISSANGIVSELKGNVSVGDGVGPNWANLNVSSYYVNIDGNVDVSTYGKVAISNTGTLNVSGTYTQTGGLTQVDGVLNTSANGFSLNGGKLQGSGLINGNVVVNQATVAPGDPVTLTINGDLVMNGGILDIKMDATGSDHINVSGQAMFDLNSEVHFEFINGYQPQVGDSLDWFSASNGFSGLDNLTYQFFGLPQGISLSFNENPGTGSLSWTATPTAVPLPPALWLFGSTLAGFGLFGRRTNQPGGHRVG
ncbi:MAG: hypothetical protein HOP23_13860 [Methylococcaceae bacterium]|nr:hypothetical protein [Methylococcaceae bacterium]